MMIVLSFWLSMSVETTFTRQDGASVCAFCAFLIASIGSSPARADEMKRVPIAAAASEMQHRDRFMRQPKQRPWLCNWLTPWDRGLDRLATGVSRGNNKKMIRVRMGDQVRMNAEGIAHEIGLKHGLGRTVGNHSSFFQHQELLRITRSEI